MLEAFGKRSIKEYFSKLILTVKNIIKNWIDKGKCDYQNFPKEFTVDNIAIIDVKQILESFNKFITKIGPKLAKEIKTSTIKFEDYLEQCGTIQPGNAVSINKLKDVFFSLQINKSSGYDGNSFSVVKCCFGSLHKTLLDIFNLPMQKVVFQIK